MANPLPKSTVHLASPATYVSRIRRDPPPPEKKVTLAEIKRSDARNVVIGIIVAGLAVVVVLIAVNNTAGWSPSQYTIHIKDSI